MTPTVDHLLSDFMDAWAAGRRPDPQTFLERASPPDRAALAEAIADYLVLAPDPAYDLDALAAIETEPVVAEVVAAASRDRSLWPSLLPRLRAHLGASSAELGASLARALGLAGSEEKVRRYLEEMEDGSLPPAGVSDRVFAALARLVRMPAGDLRAAGGAADWSSAGAFARADDTDARAEDLAHLDVLADLAGAPAPGEWDEVDELFRGG